MIYYRDGYDGQLVEDYKIQLPENLYPEASIDTDFIKLDKSGMLTIMKGYAWDYASVPITHRFSNWLQGNKSKVPSLVHDALCQLHRNGFLTMQDARLHADELFYQLLLDRKFWKIRAWLWFQAVKHWGKRHKQHPKPIREAP